MADNSLGKALKEIRNFHGFTQAQACEYLDISKSYLSEIENGKPISVDLLQKFADLYEIPASSLLLFSETINTERKSTKTRLKFATKILKVMEWINDREEFAKRKKA